MEIYNNEKDNYISVWMTKEEQQLFDRQELTDLLLSTVKNKKCKGQHHAEIGSTSSQQENALQSADKDAGRETSKRNLGTGNICCI